MARAVKSPAASRWIARTTPPPCAPVAPITAMIFLLELMAGVSLPGIQLPAGVQVIEVEQRVQHERVAPDGFATIDRVVAEEHDVSLVHRHVHHHRMLRNTLATIQQPRHEQIVRTAEAEHDARALIWGNDVERVAELLIRDGCGLPRFYLGLGRRLVLRSERRASLHDVRIVRRAAPGGTAFVGPAATTTTS